MSVRVYTDGASSPDGTGGWAAMMFVDGALIDGRYGGCKSTTNNQMELTGLIQGMLLLPLVEHLRCADCGVVPVRCKPLSMVETENCPLLGIIKRPVYPEAVVVSDSAYCVQGMKYWVLNWKLNGWKTKEKQPVKNRELWEEADRLARLTTADFEWVKGHSGNQGNELADHWATYGKSFMATSDSPSFIATPAMCI